MQTIAYDFVDKSEWGEGPWLEEPDKVQWLDEESNLPCIIKRGPLGAWCGYVGVSKSHPAHGVDYHKVDVDVHGGLTYANFCQPHEEGEEGHAICHVVEDGEDDHVWWLGFDCGHAWDLIPQMRVIHKKMLEETGDPIWDEEHLRDETYRDQEYVTAETLSLARQLAKA